MEAHIEVITEASTAHEAVATTALNDQVKLMESASALALLDPDHAARKMLQLLEHFERSFRASAN